MDRHTMILSKLFCLLAISLLISLPRNTSAQSYDVDTSPQTEDIDAVQEAAADEDREMDRGDEPPPEDRKFESIGRDQRQEEADGKYEADLDEDRQMDKGDGMR